MITEEQFEAMCARKPEYDDMARVNCNKCGQLGHFACGICDNHHIPRLQCGCLLIGKQKLPIENANHEVFNCTLYL